MRSLALHVFVSVVRVVEPTIQKSKFNIYYWQSFSYVISSSCTHARHHFDFLALHVVISVVSSACRALPFGLDAACCSGSGTVAMSR